jgi:hypothetical protein
MPFRIGWCLKKTILNGFQHLKTEGLDLLN